MRSFAPLLAAGLVALSTLGATCSAFAWDVAKSTNGVILVRESTDPTTTANVRVYYDYKGGGMPYGATNSYNQSVTYTNALYGSTDAYEVDLIPGYLRQLVEYGGRAVAVRYEPLQVSVENTHPIETTFTPSPSSPPSVSVVVSSGPESLTVSLAESSTVGLSDEDRQTAQNIMIGVVLCTVALGVLAGFHTSRGF